MQEQVYTYTVIESNSKIGKIFDADLVNTNDSNTITQGNIDVWRATITEIAQDLDELTGNECLTTGEPKHYTSAALCVQADYTPGATGRNGRSIIPRTKEHFTFPDEPGLLMFDHDPAHWTFAPLTSVAMVIEALGESLGIDLAQYDYIAKPSSSSCVLDADGNEVRGIQGVHVYVAVKSLAVLNTKGKGDRLLDLAASRGQACGVLSASGQFLRRGAFDSSLHKAPNSVVYAGAAEFLGEHSSNRQVEVNDVGQALDLGMLIDGVDVERAEEAWATLRQAIKPQQAIVREKYIVSREAQGITREQTEQALNGGKLPGNWVITHNDGSQVKLWEMLVDPANWGKGISIRDPLEPEYGAGKAMIYVSEGRCNINSFAHGQKTYTASLDAITFREALEASPKRSELWRGLVRQVHNAKPAEAARIVLELVEEEDRAQGFVAAEIAGLVRDARVMQRSDDVRSWDGKYVFLASGSGEFLNIENLDNTGRVNTMNASAFNICYANITGDNQESAAAWAVSSNLIPTYLGMQCQAPKTLFGATPGCGEYLNVWRPGPTFARSDVSPAPWLALVEHLFLDEDEREVLLDWLAWSLQYPGVKCNWQMLIKSVEGVGKDSMIEPLRWGMGAHNLREIETHHLMADFNEYMLSSPSLLVIQELDAAHKDACRNRLKPLAASPPTQIQVNIKGQREIVVGNTGQVLVLTNEAHPFSLDGDDRRWMFLEANGKKKDHAFFDALWGWYHAGGMRTVCAWLANRDLSGFDPNHLPLTTNFKRDVIEYSKTNAYMQVEEYLRAHPAVEYAEAAALASTINMYDRGKMLNVKQVQGVLAKLGWASTVFNGRIDGKVIGLRRWASPALLLRLSEGDVSKQELVEEMVKN